jgi:poly-gamma-glutamate synthesis protein (capsule biosynthesis protein)
LDGYTLRFAVKVLIAALAIPLPFLYQRIDTGHWRSLRYPVNAFLILLAALSVPSYFDFGTFRYGRYINPHDVFHYYIGAKYSREISYADLYRCTLLADMEGKKVFKGPNIRNLDTHGFEPVAGALRQGEEIKQRFSPGRWNEFKHDILFFESIMPARKWNQILTDKGYNATPVWNSVARFLTNRASTDNWLALNALLLIDPLLMSLAFAALWWAFGWRVAFFAAIYFDTNFMGSFVHIKGALLRLDWVMLLVIATCLLKKGRYKSAGVVMAYSSMARVFPAIFMFGIGTKLIFRAIEYVREAARTRKFIALNEQDRRYIAFLLAFAIACAALAAIATIDDGGIARWHSFSQKISVHNSDISTTRVGFKYIFLSPFKTFGEKVNGFKEHTTLWRLLMAVLLILAAFPTRRIEDYETIPYGFAPAFFLTAPTFYYYVMLVVPLLFFAPKIARWPRAIGMAGMFAICAASYLLSRPWPLGFSLCLMMSCMLLALVVHIMATAFWAGRPETVPAPSPPDTPAMAPPAGRPTRKERYGKRKKGAAGKSANAPKPSRQEAARPEKPLVSAHLRRVFVGGAVACAILLLAAALVWAFHRTNAPLPRSAETSSDDVQIVLVGDVMLARNVAASIEKHNMDYTFPFQKTLQYTTNADLACCNLECPVTQRGEALSKNYTFHAAREALAGLRSAGFDLVSLANNHVLDFGPPGLEDTLQALMADQIGCLGITTDDAPQTPAIFDIKGVKIGWLAYADPNTKYAYAKEYLQFPTRPARAEKEIVRGDIARLRPQVDVVVVCIHWGTEYQTQPDPWQVELGRFIIDCGANIVAGHHPHVLQEPEWYNGGLIIYSLGNFVFDQHSRPATRLSRLFRVFVNKGGISRAEYLPLEITNQDWQPTPTAPSFVSFTPPTGMQSN